MMISAVDATDKDAKNKLNTGKHVAQVGVIIQLVAFGMFAVAAVRFNFTSKRFTGSLSERYENVGEKEYIIGGVVKDKNWPTLLRVVNFTTILILVSSSPSVAVQSLTCTRFGLFIDSWNSPKAKRDI